MSPTEFDLQTALHHGDGDGLDVDRIVAGARARRAQRRTQLLSTATVVVLVAAAGTGGALIWGASDAGNSGGGFAARNPADAGASGNPNAAAPTALAPTPANGAGRASTTEQDSGVACPASLPHTLLPGGGSPGQFGSDGPLLSDPVDSIVVCGYGPHTRPANAVTPARLVLTGADATALASSLENASKTRTTQICPKTRPAAENSLAIIGVTSDGTADPVVTTTLTQPACNVQVTNGRAVRYNWAPPPNLQRLLTTLTPRPAASGLLPHISPSHKIVGSPPR